MKNIKPVLAMAALIVAMLVPESPALNRTKINFIPSTTMPASNDKTTNMETTGNFPPDTDVPGFLHGGLITINL